jgi:hypothetical protein
MVFVNEIKQLEGREKVMWQREFDGVVGSGTPPRSEMKVYLDKENLCSK